MSREVRIPISRPYSATSAEPNPFHQLLGDLAERVLRRDDEDVRRHDVSNGLSRLAEGRLERSSEETVASELGVSEVELDLHCQTNVARGLGRHLCTGNPRQKRGEVAADDLRGRPPQWAPRSPATVPRTSP